MLFDYVSQGGPIAWILVVISVFGMATMLWKFITIHTFWKRERTKLPTRILDDLSKINSPQGVMIELVQTEVSCAFAPLEKGITAVSTIASLAPLIGLLGTVMGIFTSFGAMEQAGTADPSVLAGGIKLALITTIIGLIVAIPHVAGYNYFISTIDAERTEVENGVLKELEKRIGSAQ